MAVVVNFDAYKSKPALTALRELLILAHKGQIESLCFDVRLKDGSRRAVKAGRIFQEAHDETADDRGMRRISCMRK